MPKKLNVRGINDIMAKGRRRTWIYGLVIAAIVIVVVVIYLLNSYLSGQSYRVQNTVAVINDSTNEIVWVGASQLCIPAAPNTRLVSDCMKEGAGYSCDGTYYNVSAVGISC